MTRPGAEAIEPGWGWHAAANYSPAMTVGDLVFVSGQVGITPAGVVAGADFDSQVRQAFANLAAVLEAAGSDLSRVVKVSFFLTEQSQFASIPGLRAEYFRPPYPADTTIVVRALARPGLLVEIEAVALVGTNEPGRQ